jgi:cytochrome c-type biogenesis protein CcmH
MTLAFWVCAALLLAGALLFVLPPLWRAAVPRRGADSPLAAYREQRAQLDAELARGALDDAQARAAMEELQARVIEEVGDAQERPAALAPLRSLAIGLALLLPVLAIALYALLGTPAALHPDASPAAGEAPPHAMDRAQIEAMVETLADKLRRNPDDAAGWHMLARSYVAFDRLPEAAEAYDRANRLSPGDPEILADYADVLAMVNGRNLEGRPMALVREALAIDPRHAKSLSLAGTAAFNRGEFAQAADWWKQLLATLPAGSTQARAVRENIAQAEAGAGRPAAAPAAAAAADAAIEGTVDLAESLRAQLAPGATLFVHARAPEGSRMPLAVLRVPAERFPLRFRLDDTLAMAPQARLSTQSQVVLVARISRSGQATPQAGDLTGTLGPVKVGARGVQLRITEAVQ